MDAVYTTPVRMLKLTDELGAAGITPTLVEGDGGADALGHETIGTWVHIIAPQPEAAVDAIVVAHDATTPSANEQQRTVDRDILQDMRHDYQVLLHGLEGIKADLDVLANHAQTLSTITITGTLAQTQAKVQSTFQSLGGDLGTLIHDVDLLCNGSTRLLNSLDVYIRATTQPG